MPAQGKTPPTLYALFDELQRLREESAATAARLEAEKRTASRAVLFILLSHLGERIAALQEMIGNQLGPLL